jgi:hypothetical protein
VLHKRVTDEDSVNRMKIESNKEDRRQCREFRAIDNKIGFEKKQDWEEIENKVKARKVLEPN